MQDYLLTLSLPFKMKCKIYLSHQIDHFFGSVESCLQKISNFKLFVLTNHGVRSKHLLEAAVFLRASPDWISQQILDGLQWNSGLKMTMMGPDDFSDPLIFPLAPPWSIQNVRLNISMLTLSLPYDVFPEGAARKKRPKTQAFMLWKVKESNRTIRFSENLWRYMKLFWHDGGR